MSSTFRASPKTNEPHRFPIRVYYEDTDAGGIVYHANYLKFAERGRTEWLRTSGWDHARVAAEWKLLLIVRHVTIDYKAPSRLDDLLEVETSILEWGNTSLTLKQDVLRGDKLLAELKVVVVAVAEDGRPARLPPQLRQIFGG
jgi:acyl-CoA thioester hydrolase